MSGPIRRLIGPAVARLRARLIEIRPVLDAQERTEEGMHFLRKQLVHVKRSLRFIEDQNEAWRVYIAGLAGNERAAEEQVYDQFANDNRHFTEWLEDAREVITEIEITISDETEASSDDTPSVELGRPLGNPIRNQAVDNNRGGGVQRQAGLEAPPTFFPKLPWSYFYGDPLMWQVFWQSFQTNVGSKPIPDAQKCAYLLLSLRGKAERAVRGYQATAENYQLIVDALTRQFGNQRVIKEALQNELLNLAPANEAAASLRARLEDVERICRQLNVIGIGQSENDFVMMTIKSKFPRAIVLEALKQERESGRDWNVEELRNGLEEIIGLREEAMRSCHSVVPRGGNGNKGQKGNSDTERVFMAQGKAKWGKSGKDPPPCFFCQQSHWASDCDQYKTRDERIKLIRDQNRCFRCLRKDHSKKDCKSDKTCGICREDHHKAICPKANKAGNNQKKGKNKKSNEKSGENVESKFSGALMSGEPGEVLLMSAKVQITSDRNLKRSVSALMFFDTGSQVSLISDKLIRQLKPPKVAERDLDLLGVRQHVPDRIHSPIYRIKLILVNGGVEELFVSRIDFITTTVRRAKINAGLMELVDEQPDLSISMGEFFRFFREAEPWKGNLYRAITTIGPIVCGQLDLSAQRPGKTLPALTAVLTGQRQQEKTPDGHNFWDLESIGVRDNPADNDDEIALKLFEDTVKRRNGRYVVRWPWKAPREQLPTNFGMAYRRFVSLVEKLKKVPEIMKLYDGIFVEQKRRDMIEEAKCGGTNEHFLPHHMVMTSNKPRVVFDASAKVRGGKSLNEMLYRGEVILAELPGLLIRSRLPKIVMWCDIEKAFLALELEPEDREVTKFIWLRDIEAPINPSNIMVYRFRRVPFGVVASPFLLGATVRYHLKQADTPLAREVERNSYVDNEMVGCESEEEAIRKYKELKALFAEARMNLREFVTNSEEVNGQIPEEDRLGKERPKILGIRWDIKSDVISVDFPPVGERRLSRRVVLKELAAVFDPLGWAVPCLLPAKLFFQRLWDKERGWDDPLAEEEQVEWRAITSTWRGMSISMDRRVIQDLKGKMELHTFVDASKDAYAACVYLRAGSSTVVSKLLYARSRLKPKQAKSLTIPRLELLAVLIGTRALKYVTHEIGIDIVEKFVWSDSKPVLSWIQAAEHEKQPKFVANRLAEIKEYTDVVFGYIPTGQNPADIASRGCTPGELKNHPLWWNGPHWILLDREKWPREMTFKVKPRLETELELGQQDEARIEEKVLVTAKPIQMQPHDWFIDVSRFSRWNRLVWSMARAGKFAVKWMNKVGKKPSSANLSAFSEGYAINGLDYEHAERMVLRLGQLGWEEYEKSRKDFRTRKDENGLLRLDTRVGNSGLGTNFIKPIVVCRSSPILNLLIQWAHEKVNHAGVDATLTEFLGKFWSPRCRAAVKKVLKGCARCRRIKSPAFALPEMPPYPMDRVKRAIPFEAVSIDYLGPSLVKMEGTQKKFWVVLITCLITRGVYLEAVFDLSAFTFLNVLKRFASRRGVPKRIWSDNGTQFTLAAKVAASVELRGGPPKSVDELMAYLVENEIMWRFIPALSPWANGTAEALVKSVKAAFKSALGRLILSEDELRTFVAEVECSLNSRPLTFVSTEADGLRALRPIDLISPGTQLGISFPNVDENDEGDPDFRINQMNSEEKLRAQLKRTERALNYFWERWEKEYLVLLRDRTQWKHKGPRSQLYRNPRVGEVVLVEDEFKSRNLWPMARIIELNGKPGVVRSAKIRMASGRIIERPVNRLYALEAQGFLEEEAEPEIPKPIEQRVGRPEHNRHPMITRAKARALNVGIIPIISLLFVLMVNLALGQSRIKGVKGKILMDCKDCMVECVKSGVNLKTPSRMQKMEICCGGSCLSHPFTRELTFSLSKEQLVVDHMCEITYWSRVGRKFRRRIICPPVDECELIKCEICLELIANPSCLPSRTVYVFGLMFGLGIIGVAMLVGCVRKVFGQLIWILRCMFCPLKLCKLWKTRDNRPSEQEEELLGGTYAGRKSRRRNKRLWKLGLMMVVMALQIKQAIAGAEVAVVQASSEDCIRTAKGTICQIRAAATITLLPAGQVVSLALKNNVGEMMGSLELALNSLRLHCSQQSERMLRSYRVKVASVKKCPAEGSCVSGKCHNVRMGEDLPELKGFANAPGNSFCMQGESLWAYQCIVPTHACFFYRIYAELASDNIFEIVRCLSWDWELMVKIRLEVGGNITERELILFPGITRDWGSVSLTPLTISQSPPPVLADRFLVTDTKVALIGEGLRNDLHCSTQNFSECKLDKEACRECWVNNERELVECGCQDSILENWFNGTEYTLPLTTARLNLMHDGRKILSQTEYAPVGLLVRLEGLTMAVQYDHSTCRITPGDLTGCYNCATGGFFSFECNTDWGTAMAEVECKEGPRFLVKCDQRGEQQNVTLPFDRADILTKCSVSCPGGATNFKLKGRLRYVPRVEGVWQTGDSEKTVYSRAWNWEELAKVDWKSVLKFLFRWDVAIWMIFCGILAVLALYILFRFNPIFRGYKWLIIHAIGVFSYGIVSGGGPQIGGDAVESSLLGSGDVHLAEFDIHSIIRLLFLAPTEILFADFFHFSESKMPVIIGDEPFRRVPLVEFAEERFGWAEDEIGVRLLHSARSRCALVVAIHEAIEAGGLLCAEMGAEEFTVIGGDDWTLLPYMPRGASKSCAMSEETFNAQVGKVVYPLGTDVGVGICRWPSWHGRETIFHPLGGLFLELIMTPEEIAGEFFSFVDELEREGAGLPDPPEERVEEEDEEEEELELEITGTLALVVEGQEVLQIRAKALQISGKFGAVSKVLALFLILLLVNPAAGTGGSTSLGGGDNAAPFDSNMSEEQMAALLGDSPAPPAPVQNTGGGSSIMGSVSFAPPNSALPASGAIPESGTGTSAPPSGPDQRREVVNSEGGRLTVQIRPSGALPEGQTAPDGAGTSSSTNVHVRPELFGAVGNFLACAKAMHPSPNVHQPPSLFISPLHQQQHYQQPFTAYPQPPQQQFVLPPPPPQPQLPQPQPLYQLPQLQQPQQNCVQPAPQQQQQSGSSQPLPLPPPQQQPHASSSQPQPVVPAQQQQQQQPAGGRMRNRVRRARQRMSGGQQFDLGERPMEEWRLQQVDDAAAVASDNLQDLSDLLRDNNPAAAALIQGLQSALAGLSYMSGCRRQL